MKSIIPLMHGHEFNLLPDSMSLLPLPVIGFAFFFLTGALPIPVGYERGKIQWIKWCSAGMHAHTVYWTDNGFQTLHPNDRGARR